MYDTVTNLAQHTNLYSSTSAPQLQEPLNQTKNNKINLPFTVTDTPCQRPCTTQCHLCIPRPHRLRTLSALSYSPFPAFSPTCSAQLYVQPEKGYIPLCLPLCLICLHTLHCPLKTLGTIHSMCICDLVCEGHGSRLLFFARIVQYLFTCFQKVKSDLPPALQLWSVPTERTARLKLL